MGTSCGLLRAYLGRLVLVDLVLGVMQPGNARHNLSNLGVVKRRPASHAIPRQQQFQRYFRVAPCHFKCPVNEAMIELR
jgi:hypothetical protein